MNEICIVAAKRTPIGRFLGGLQKKTAVELACAAGEAALQEIDRKLIDMVIVGNVLAAGQGMNIGRQIGIGLALPVSVPAFTVNMMCASGMQAVLLAAQAIRAGDAKVVLCGGTESMSNAPHLIRGARAGLKLGDGKMVDSLLHDGLVDSFDHQHMGIMAERLATLHRISRERQDAFALASQQRYFQAQAARIFDDELAILDGLNCDEHPRADTTMEKLGTLKPAFNGQGTVTAGNSSGINDGAAMLVVTKFREAKERGWKPLAFIDAHAITGCDPKIAGMGAAHVIRKLCQQQDVALESFDSVEINEAFAAQVLASAAELCLDEKSVNPNGGAIAMGHPIGASGARLITHLAWSVARARINRGLAALCVGGGMGVAMSVRRAD